MIRLLCSLLCGLIVCSAAAQEDPKWSEAEKKFIRMNEALAKRMTGLYSNQKQADTATSRQYASQELRTFPIWEDSWMGKRPEVWFYFGWFAEGSPDNPLVEFIGHVRPISGDTLMVAWYHIPAEHNNKREWERELPFRTLTPDILTERPSACRCQMTRADEEKEGYIRSIVPCPITSTLGSKYKYFTFDVSLRPKETVARNKFFDKNFQVVFEYKNPGYFQLVTRNRLKFSEGEE